MSLDATTIACIVIAPFIGSFLAVVAIRLMQGRSVLFGRSACDRCGTALGPLELIPLVSFLGLRGRCRHCGAKIDPLHPAMEAGALAIAIWAAFVTGGWIVAASCGLGWTLLTLAAIDWRTGYLPDVLTLPLIAAGLGVAYAIDRAAVPGHVVGAAAGFIVFAVLSEGYRRLRGRDGLGLGDAKLLAASGAWLSWSGLPTTVLYAAFLGLALVLARRGRGQALTATDKLAFGPALAAATWLVWLYGPLVPG
ncbi:MAG TPA: A24 family peptidase [Rhizomicrobium sp.]|jgi:leader peptidase (prepilin peptidase)/N-methyltransferase|nr:A24 family peptidase [Rhizomicrobium sp.]